MSLQLKQNEAVICGAVKKNPDYNKANSEKKLPKKTNKKLSSNEEQIMEKLQQQISINTEKCMESDSE